MARFQAIHVNSFQELQGQVELISGGRRPYAFRGYTASDPTNPSGNIRPLAFVTGLERICLGLDQGLNLAQAREAAVVREFMRRAHHHLSDVPSPRGLSNEADPIEWLALMQHHGAPTRLLDWTFSLYVATHFASQHAIHQPERELAIWMVDTEWCLTQSAALCEAAGTPAPKLANRPIRLEDYPTAFGGLLSGRYPASVWPLTPFRLNERLTLQRGVFLAAADVTRSFAENLAGLPGCYDRENLVCFEMPRRELAAIQRVLYEANVTEATLFPGLDGFARSLWRSAAFLDLNKNPASIIEI